MFTIIPLKIIIHPQRFVSKQLGMETDDVTLDHMIQAADKDKDGTVSYREFVMVLMRK